MMEILASSNSAIPMLPMPMETHSFMDWRRLNADGDTGHLDTTNAAKVG